MLYYVCTLKSSNYSSIRLHQDALIIWDYIKKEKYVRSAGADSRCEEGELYGSRQ